MGLFKKSGGVPDVGQEEAFDQEKNFSSDNEDHEEGKELAQPTLYQNSVNAIPSNDISQAQTQLEINKLNAKIESISEWIKQFYERFSYISESIGGIRAMAMNNEKEISKIALEAEKSFDIVKEVKPETFRVDYQKLDSRLTLLESKLTSNEGFSDNVMSEIKDLRKKAEMFMGTDALLQLNEEIKKDLIDLQKLSARVRVNADKSEQLFIELRKGFAENQKLNKVFANLDSSYGGLQQDINKLKIDFSNIIKREEYGDFRKTTENKIIALENTYGEMKRLREDHQRLAGIIETILAVSRKNEDDIGKLAVSIGDDRIKKVSDYEERFNTLLEIVEKMSLEITRLRKKMNVPTSDFDDIRQQAEFLSNTTRSIADNPPEKKNNEVKEFKSTVANQILEQQTEEEKELTDAEKRLKELEESNVVKD